MAPTNSNSPSPAVTASSSPKPVEDQTAAPLDAAIIFKQTCTSCHGVDLEGRMIGPNLQKVGARLTEDKIIHQITNGGERMPSFKDKLNEQEIKALVAWLADKK
ncbi:c-type cytochrome [Paenibacillus psychroresistens]|uniref:c-type cytochrome n=1 Tax=Paenibacillus psychroresistens TaxID=1778678 RepID=UPI001D0364E2|nr:cytochrome c [Paenibacillus psychroresistens]